MRRDRLRRAVPLLALVVTASTIGAATAQAAAPTGQYRGTVAGGGKFVVDVNGGKVVTAQAYYPFQCTGGGTSGTGELLVQNLSVKVKKASNGTSSFTLKIRNGEQDGNPQGTIKGTWNKAATKLKGTIALADSAYVRDCLPGTPGENATSTYSATKQAS